MKEIKNDFNSTKDHFKSIKDDLNSVKNDLSSLNKTVINLSEDLGTGFLPLDCCQIMIASNFSAETELYKIKDPSVGGSIFNYAKIHVRCDMETDGGGWIVIQRRNANFERVNFTRNWEDYVNGFGDLDGGGTGDGNHDAFVYNNGQYFTTYDRDNNGRNCGYRDQAGWWYRNCAFANLNGRHEMSGLPGIERRIEQRLIWNSGSGHTVYTNSIMMIRSNTCGLTS